MGHTNTGIQRFAALALVWFIKGLSKPKGNTNALNLQTYKPQENHLNISEQVYIENVELLL